MKKLNRMISLTLLLLLVITMVAPTPSMAIDTTVDLKSAESFALLAGSTITNTGTTIIEGDVGLYAGTAFTGQGDAIISGEVYLADTDGVALQAKNDMLAAYNEAMLLPDVSIGAELGGKTITPGIYGYASDMELTGTLTLDGQDNPDAIFVFKAGSTLTTMSDSNIELINGANFKNVYWLVKESATLGTNSVFAGNILAQQSITVTTGADVQGKLFAYIGAVTLDNNEITNVTTSALTVVKVVQGDTGYPVSQPFSITVTGPNFTDTRDFVDGESFSWNNLQHGEYTITENRTGLDNSWAVVKPVKVQLMAKQPKSVTVTNSYNALGFGSLTFEKNVDGVTDSMALPIFNITLTGPGTFSETRDFVRDEPYTWESLVPGEYTITESRTSLNSRWAVVGAVDVLVEANQSHSAAITNVYTPSTDSTPVDSTPVDSTPVDSSPYVPPYGSLTVGKIVTGDTGYMTLPTFEIMVTGPGNFSATKNFIHNEKFTWENLLPGEYNVMENRTGLGDGWTVSGEGVVKVNANQSHSTTITNEYNASEVTVPDDSTPADVPSVELTNGSLTVQKIVTGDTSGMTLPAFEITVTGPEGFTTTKTLVRNESFTWVNLVPGEYNITENRTGLNSKWTVSGEGAAQVVATQATLVTITNNYQNVVGIPQTGQTTDYSMAMSLGGIALLLAGAGVLSAKTRKKYSSKMHN